MDKSFENLISILKDFGIEKYINLKKTNEIRITVNRPLMIIEDGKSILIKEKVFDIAEIHEIFAALCEYSVHTYKNEICEGYITAQGGIRIGICGTAIYENQKIIAVKDINALNIRIPHEIFGAADAICNFAGEGGILIIGPPCSGKTTVLRDFVREKSPNFKITVVDERMEIAGIFRGNPSFEIGEASVLNGYFKSDGIKSAVRSMAPDIIVCDEFGDENDILSSVYAMKSGVQMVATMHAFDREDFITKPIFNDILRYKIFEHYVFINREHIIYEIIKAGDFV